jgi:SAM-dependent methyltransferase
LTVKHSDSEQWLAWLASPPGAYVRQWQQTQFDKVVPDVFGFHALQCGLPGLNPLARNRMPHRVTAMLGSEKQAHQPHAEGIDCLELDSFEALPIDSECLDLVILPHVLEFADDPHQVLREVDRVLRPEGRVLITGLNPVSLWGARQIFLRPLPNRVTRPYLPAQGDFISVPRLKDWFKLLSFEMDTAEFGCFAPPCRTEQWLARWSFMESAGDRFWPICGAVYFVSAVKRVANIRLIGPAWKTSKYRKKAALVRPALPASPVNTSKTKKQSTVQ